MIKIKNKNQIKLFNPWNYLSPKRHKMLEKSWAGVFQKNILPSLPVNKIATYFHQYFGRPTKELHTVLGVLVLQQAFDLTDLETVDQLAFNIQWHYALDIPEETDESKYMCPKTLWSMRNTVTENKLDNIIFEEVTAKLAQTFKVDTSKQRIDSIHIKSNMSRLGRIGIFSEAIHRFLVNLNRSNKEQFEGIDQGIVDKYLTEEAMGCFSKVKPSESRKSLSEVSKDLFDLVQRFKDNDGIKAMYSYKQLERVLNEQCNLTESDETPVEIKAPCEIPSNSLQNPSDPDATYSAHKGQGYQAQIMETYSPDKEDKGLNLITYVHVEPAHESDANALIPAIESVTDRNLQPKELLADSLYGSDENCEKAKELSVDVVSPVMGAPKSEGISLSAFETKEDGKITRCPQGHNPARIKRKNNRIVASFNKEDCSICPLIDNCPVKEGKKFYYLRYTIKEVRIAKRRSFEETEEFKDRYRWRAGIEGTMSRYDRVTGVKNLRVRGLDAVRFCAILKALALNIFRVAAFQLAENGHDPDTFCLFPGLFHIILSVKEHFLTSIHRFKNYPGFDSICFCTNTFF